MDGYFITDLNSSELLDVFTKHFQDWVWKFNNVEEAEWFLKNIGPVIESEDFSKLDENLQQGWRKLYIACSVVALPFNTEEQLLNLLEKSVVEGLKLIENIDFWPKFKQILLRYDYEDRDTLKLKLRQVLERNQEVLTKNKLQSSGQELPAT